MAQSKLELAVGTGQWDAGLKKAQQALNSFTQAQGGLQQALDKDNGKMQSFVQMMGKMDSTASTAKGQMNDYKRVLEQLTADYNKMSEAQRKSIGTDYLQTIDALKQKFQAAKQQVDEFNRSLGNTSEIKLPEGGGGLFGGGKLDGMLQVFGGNMLTKAAGFAASFASEIAGCVSQGVELARQGEGVRIAFERLGRGDILDGLREATHGTVTDIELMKAAVKFNDFKLPVEELGTMLAFAQQKAKDTGQSVDYMVDSIVTGLGRKSLMILDNLGLSATEIRERMKETGDMTKAVGAIIRDQMAKAGDYVETAADRAAQANVNMQNKMEELGRKFAPLQEASNSLWTSMKIGILDVIGGPLTDLLNKLTEAGRLKNALNNINGDGTKGSTVVANQLKQLQAAKKSGASQYMLNTMQSGVIEGYNRQINEREQAIKDWNAWRRGIRSEGLQERIGQWRDKYGTDVNSIKAQADAYRAMIAEYRKGAKDIMTPVTVDVKTDNAVKNLDELKVKLADLQAQRKKVAAGSDEAKRLDTEIRQVKADIKLQDPNALKTTTTKLDEIQKIQKKINDLTNEAYTADSNRVEEIKVQIAELQKEEKRLENIKNLVTGKSTQMTVGLSGFNEQTISAWTSMMKSEISKADLGSDLYNSLVQNVSDMSTLTTTVQDAIKLGLKIPQEDVQEMFETIFDRGTLPDDLYAGMIQKFIDEFKERTGKDLQVDADGSLSTGTDKGKDKKQDNIVKQLEKFNGDFSKMTGGVSSIVSGIQSMGVEIPKEIQNVIGVLSGVSSILSGITTLLALIQIDTKMTAATNTVKTIPVIGWAMANGGIVPAFAHGGLIGKAAGGMLIPGNSFSGDNLRMPVDGGRGWIGVNSGELILNHAQQGNLAAQLEGAGLQNLKIDWVLKGDALYAVMNNNGRRTGRGEVVQRNRI